MTLSNSLSFGRTRSLVGSCIHSGDRTRFHLVGLHLSGLHFESAAPGSTSPSLDASLIALNLQHRGTLPRSKPYRLEVFTPETSPNWTPALHGFREAGFLCLAIDGTRQRGPALTRTERAGKVQSRFVYEKRV
jgi:hypothetical protein